MYGSQIATHHSDPATTSFMVDFSPMYGSQSATHHPDPPPTGFTVDFSTIYGSQTATGHLDPAHRWAQGGFFNHVRFTNRH
jgi:hypothetical protein